MESGGNGEGKAWAVVTVAVQWMRRTATPPCTSGAALLRSGPLPIDSIACAAHGPRFLSLASGLGRPTTRPAPPVKRYGRVTALIDTGEMRNEQIIR